MTPSKKHHSILQIIFHGFEQQIPRIFCIKGLNVVVFSWVLGNMFIKHWFGNFKIKSVTLLLFFLGQDEGSKENAKQRKKKKLTIDRRERGEEGGDNGSEGR